MWRTQKTEITENCGKVSLMVGKIVVYRSTDRPTDRPTYHNHLHLGASGTVFHDDVIQEDNLRQFHRNVILIAAATSHIHNANKHLQNMKLVI